MNYYEITTEHEGRIIRGMFTYLRINEFGIRLIDPASELCRSSAHIPVLALSAYRFTNEGEITENCIQRAEIMLKDLYIDNLFLEENRDKFDTCIRELVPDISCLKEIRDQEVEKYQTTKRQLKKKFKNNEISEKEYTSNLRKLQDDEFFEKEASRDNINKTLGNLIIQHFGEKLNCSLRAYIENKAEEIANES